MTFKGELSRNSSEENVGGVARFTNEASEILRRKHYVILTLKGRSLKDFRLGGRAFSPSVWFGGCPFENVPSMTSEVAINLENQILPHSENKTLSQQLKSIEHFSRRISRQIPGAQAIMGGVSDYADLAFTYSEIPRTYPKAVWHLFGEGRVGSGVRTITLTENDKVAFVYPTYGFLLHGWISAGRHVVPSLEISQCSQNIGTPRLFAMPLLVPVQ